MTKPATHITVERLPDELPILTTEDDIFITNPGDVKLTFTRGNGTRLSAYLSPDDALVLANKIRNAAMVTKMSKFHQFMQSIMGAK